MTTPVIQNFILPENEEQDDYRLLFLTRTPQTVGLPVFHVIQNFILPEDNEQDDYWSYLNIYRKKCTISLGINYICNIQLTRG